MPTMGKLLAWVDAAGVAGAEVAGVASVAAAGLAGGLRAAARLAVGLVVVLAAGLLAAMNIPSQRSGISLEGYARGPKRACLFSAANGIATRRGPGNTAAAVEPRSDHGFRRQDADHFGQADGSRAVR